MNSEIKKIVRMELGDETPTGRIKDIFQDYMYHLNIYPDECREFIIHNQDKFLYFIRSKKRLHPNFKNKFRTGIN